MPSNPDTTETQAQLDQANQAFWEELCGTGLAMSLGITDRTAESLHRFDDAYFGFYPYLLEIVQPERMKGKRVVEIGLGFGSLGQKLAEQAGEYIGLDIAAKPAESMRHRLQMAGLPGTALQGSCHNIPLPAGSVDFVVSIGCFHHTGDVQRCLDETHRILRPGGAAVLMVYNKFSLRQWVRWPRSTFAEALRCVVPFHRRQQLGESERRAYDANALGQAAPETVCLSIGDLRRMLRSFAHVSFRKRNCDPLVRNGSIIIGREKLLPTVGRLLGLDVYFEATKAAAAIPRAAA